MKLNVLLAKPYGGQEVTGWLISEKLDGVRAIWTGSELLSRNGNQFSAPEWFTAQLPKGVELDGELFIGRGKFQTTAGVVKKKVAIDSEWATIRYCVFDAPEVPGGFEQRLAFCAEILSGCKIAEVVPHRVCRGEADLNQYFSALCAAGAEGVMLRRPGSAYEYRRTSSLLKYKPFDSDEAEMVGTEQGEGKFSGMIGALILKWKSVTFKVGIGLSEEQRVNPPRLGAMISFGFNGLTDGGVPRFPTFIGERSYE